MKTTTATTTRKKATRRNAVQVCTAFRAQLLKALVLCERDDEPELAEACEKMRATLAEAVQKRRDAAEKQTEDVETADTLRGGL